MGKKQEVTNNRTDPTQQNVNESSGQRTEEQPTNYKREIKNEIKYMAHKV